MGTVWSCSGGLCSLVALQSAAPAPVRVQCACMCVPHCVHTHQGRGLGLGSCWAVGTLVFGAGARQPRSDVWAFVPLVR